MILEKGATEKLKDLKTRYQDAFGHYQQVIINKELFTLEEAEQILQQYFLALESLNNYYKELAARQKEDILK